MIAVTLDTYVNVLASSHINDKQGSVYHAMSDYVPSLADQK